MPFTPIPFNPFPQFGQPGYGSSGGVGGIFDFIGDIRDAVDDVDEIIDIIRGNDTPTPIGVPLPGGGSGAFPGSTALNSQLSSYIASNGISDAQINLVLNGMGNQSADESAFLDFLRAAGVVASVLTWLWENPPITWPKIAKDLMAYWGANKSNTSVVTPLVPIDWKSPGTTPAPGGGSALPVPIPGVGIPEQMGGFLPMAFDAVPTTVYKAPKGYVTVNVPQGDGTTRKMFLQKRVASALGLYKSRKKAPITATEYSAIKKAKRWEAKLAKMMNSDSCTFKAVKRTSSRR